MLRFLFENGFLFFSLDQPVTKNQILIHTKCQFSVVVSFQFQKTRLGYPLFDFKQQKPLVDVWRLVFGFYSSSNEMKITKDAPITKEYICVSDSSYK